MASFRKSGEKWRAEIVRKTTHGMIRRSMVWDTKAAAKAWAAKEETEIDAMESGTIPNKTFGQLLEKYRDEESVKRGGGKWEVIRINLMLRDPIADVQLAKLDATHVAAWRDRRLTHVSGASVRREWTILASACVLAMKEWKWLKHNPFAEAKRPEDGVARTRRVTEEETQAILAELGCDPQVAPTNVSQRVGMALLFGLETAMRDAEILRLNWSDITGRVAHIKFSKNGEERWVPLSKEAQRIVALMPGTDKNDSIFDLKSASRDQLFRRARDACGIENLHFHDARREALTRMVAKGIDVMLLAKISGHKDVRILLNTYYKPDMEAEAAKLG